MIDCKETVLDVMEITAIPIGNISASGADSVINRLTTWVPASEFSPTLSGGASNPVFSGACTIGLKAAAPGATLVPIVRTSGKAKDDESDSVAGRLHTVTVSCEADDRSGRDAWSSLLSLERVCRHLLLTMRNGSQAFVAGGEDTYQCTVERSGSKTTVQFRIQNLMGIQLLV